MRVSLLSALALVGAACTVAPVLVPDVGAERAPGTRSSAMAEVENVRITVDGTAWQGDPYDLGDTLTPIFVTIENHSDAPLRVAYENFSLVGATGFHYAALPPLKTQGQMPVSERPVPELPIVPTTVVAVGSPVRAAPPGMPPLSAPPPMSMAAPAAAPAPMLRGPAMTPVPAPGPMPRPPAPVVVTPRFQHQHFYVAPSFGVVYPGIEAWPYYYPFDAGYYNRYYDYWPTTLPTNDMINQALPEGVLEANGSISGYLYFQKVSQREPRVKFDMQLVDARGNRKLGEVLIPLAVAE